MRFAVLLFVLLGTSACQQMGTSEYGVIFRKLPPELGGGVSKNIVEPGQTVFLMPWESIYRFETRVRNLEWGRKPNGEMAIDDFVHTRAKDGNEVALAVKIQYRVNSDPAKLVRLVREVATSDEEVEEIVSVIARSDIRTYMSELNTAEFFRNESKYEGEQRVREGMEKRLGFWGIDIENVNLKEHRFERVLADSSVDRSYQEKINEVQAIDERTKREGLRKETILAEKAREYNEAKGESDRTVAEANGFKQQGQYRGDAYFEAKKNEALAIRASGEAEVKGIVEQISALSGPGGEAILKLEIVRNLLKGDPKFVILNSEQGSSGDVSVRRVDTNELLRQIGAFEALKDEPKKETVTTTNGEEGNR